MDTISMIMQMALGMLNKASFMNTNVYDIECVGEIAQNSLLATLAVLLVVLPIVDRKTAKLFFFSCQ